MYFGEQHSVEHNSAVDGRYPEMRCFEGVEHPRVVVWDLWLVDYPKRSNSSYRWDSR